MTEPDDITVIKTNVEIIRVFVEEMRGDLTRFWEDHEARLRTLESGKANMGKAAELERRITSLEIGQGELKVRQGIFSMIAAGIGVMAAAIVGRLEGK